MRITFNMRAVRYNDTITSGLANYTQASDKVNKGMNLLSPEQNANNYVAAYNVQRMLDELAQFGVNSKNASTWLTNSDNELQEAVKLISKARNELGLNGNTDTNSEESRLALAGDVANIYNALLGVANSNYMGKYIFGGYQTSKPPFTSGSNQVSNMHFISQNGGEVVSKEVYSDLPELSNGQYTVEVNVENGVATLKLFDYKGKQVILDSNGTDESGKGSNNSNTEMTFKYKPGAVINTGRGISIKLPDTNESNLRISFDYKAGSEMAYNGDNGYIFSQIGYNQDVAINMPGSNIFTQSYKTLKGTKFNTSNGIPISANTYFSQIDKSKTGISDSIKVTGTDHSGNPVGSAQILSPINPSLDLSNASEKERTLTIGYGDKLYKIVVPKAAYKSSDDLSKAMNNELKRAEYIGSIDMPVVGFDSIKHYGDRVHSEVNSGKYSGEVEPEKSKYIIDLSKEISIKTDGDRLQFVTAKGGDNVRLTVTGDNRNLLGFQDKTIATEGKDIIFEVGKDFSSSKVDPLITTHSSVNLMAGGAYEFYINGKSIIFNKPTTVQNNNVLAGQDLNSGNDYILDINGRKITIDGVDLAAAATVADKENLINQEIINSGLGSDALVTVADDGTGGFDVTLSTTTPTKKELDMMINKALESAGFAHNITASVKHSVGGTLGVYNVSFSMVNDNSSKDAQLNTIYSNTRVVPSTLDMHSDSYSKLGTVAAKEKKLGDYGEFLENLYDNSIKVSFDKGQIIIKDVRSGASKLSVNMRPSNEGVGYANDQSTVVAGKYTGLNDEEWKFNISTELLPNGRRDISVIIKDKAGNTIFNQRIDNYMGGDIELPYGVKLKPNQMGLPDPNPAITSKTTSFNVKMTAQSGLGFGDLNIIESGDNVNIFRSLKNLENALLYNISKNGFSEPSSWKESLLKSTAKPYFDGEFKGNFNDRWNYEVLPTGSKNSYFLQNEFKDKTNDIAFNQDVVNKYGSTISIGIDIYDNIAGKNVRIQKDIDISGATDPKSVQDIILKNLNDDERFIQQDIRFIKDNGKIEMQSGSGTKIATFTNTSTGNQRLVTNYIMGFDSIANKKPNLELAANATFQIADIFDTGAGTPALKDITIPAGNYTDITLLTEVNNQLQVVTGGRIKATYDDNGAFIFKNTDGSIAETSITNGIPNPIGIGQIADVAGNISTNFGNSFLKPETDLSEANNDARTLKLSYFNIATNRQESTSITLDKKAYKDSQEIADEINLQLGSIGGIVNSIQATTTIDGRIIFQTTSSGDFDGIVIEGDEKGTLGFPKAGDEAKIKVTSSDGSVVQETVINTVGKSVHVAEGLYLGFDRGTLNVADSFTNAVGSGIDNELTVLNLAEKQVLEALTIIGNRGNRVESTIKFQETVITSNNNTKAGYLGSTELDKVKATTDLVSAKTAYETALATVSRMMSISILDYLR